MGTVVRWIAQPAWVAGPRKIEAWPCPAPGCGRTVHRENPATKGWWVAPVESELLARCAREHGAHDRDGDPFPEDVPWTGGAAALETAGVLELGSGRFVVLSSPALVLEPDATGAGYVVRVVTGELAPSDLVSGGSGAGAVARSRAEGTVAAADLGLGAEPGTVRLAPLRRFLVAG
jgi:hypothetical protein